MRNYFLLLFFTSLQFVEANSELYWRPWFDVESWAPPFSKEGDDPSAYTLESIFNSQYSHVNFGVQIGGSEPFEKNSESNFIPASNMKLITAYAALRRLGSEFQFTTTLSFDLLDNHIASNIRLHGDGDPTWGMSEFGESYNTRVDSFILELKSRGVDTIRGDLQFVDSDSRYRSSNFPSGWGTDDQGQCYGTMAFAFNMNINCAFFQLTGLNSGKWIEPGMTSSVHFKIRAGSTNSLQVSIMNPELPPYFSEYIIEGTYKSGTKPEFLLAVYNPTKWINNLFYQSAKKHGLTILPALAQAHDLTPGQTADQTAFRAPVEIHYYSAPLREIIKPMLKFSLNHTADALYRFLATRFGQSSLSLDEAGSKVVQETLLWDQSELSTLSSSFEDGSGLSRKNLISPASLYSLLDTLATNKNLAELHSAIWNSLPIAGVDGTLNNRMVGTTAQGVLRAKTGTLTGVYALSGYVPAKDNKNSWIPFVMIANTLAQNRTDAITAMDRSGARIALQNSN